MSGRFVSVDIDPSRRQGFISPIQNDHEFSKLLLKLIYYIFLRY